MTSFSLQEKVYNFLVDTESHNITATAIIFQCIEEEPWISCEELKWNVEATIEAAKKNIDEDSQKLA